MFGHPASATSICRRLSPTPLSRRPHPSPIRGSSAHGYRANGFLIDNDRNATAHIDGAFDGWIRHGAFEQRHRLGGLLRPSLHHFLRRTPVDERSISLLVCYIEPMQIGSIVLERDDRPARGVEHGNGTLVV